MKEMQAKTAAAAMTPTRRAYKGAHRGDFEEEETKSERKIEEYVPVEGKTTLFFTNADVDTLLDYLVSFCKLKEAKFVLSPTKYKTSISIQTSEADEIDF